MEAPLDAIRRAGEQLQREATGGVDSRVTSMQERLTPLFDTRGPAERELRGVPRM